MVPALALLLTAADPIARYDAFMKAHPTFVATVEVSANGKAVGTGVLRLSRPHRLRFDFKAPGVDYSVCSVEKTYIELDRVEKVYDERPSTGGGSIYESRVSAAQGLLPSFLLHGAARATLGAKTTAVAVAGGDEIRATVETPNGVIELRLLIDAKGQPLRFSQKGQGGERAWRVATFAKGKTDLAGYILEAPLGYVPVVLPELAYPLQPGEAAPLTGWRKGGQAVDLREPQRGKPRLLAVLGADCPVSRAARPTLASLARSMPVLNLGPGEITDPSGASLKRLSPPGTPMFYLVGGDGKVKALWFGFDPSKAAAWEAEVRAAAK